MSGWDLFAFMRGLTGDRKKKKKPEANSKSRFCQVIEAGAKG